MANLTKILLFLALVFSFFLPIKLVSAQTSYQVKPIILIPADWKDRISSSDIDYYKQLITNATSEVQEFYREKLNGHTFNFDRNVQIIHSDQDVGETSNVSSNVLFAEEVFQRADGERFLPKTKGEIHLVFMIGSSYSRGQAYQFEDEESGRAVISHQDLLNLDTRGQLPTLFGVDRRNVEYDKNFALVTIAHELGHTFGLNFQAYKYGGFSTTHTCSDDYPNECASNAPLPYPTAAESSNSVMSYNGEKVLATYGLRNPNFKGFLNTRYNPEVTILYNSPFINPNRDPAPPITESIIKVTGSAPGQPTAYVLSNFSDFSNKGLQGSLTKTFENTNTSIDWKMQKEDATSESEQYPSESKLYVREIFNDQIGNEYSVDVKEGQAIKVGDITVIPRRVRIIETIQVAGLPDIFPLNTTNPTSKGKITLDASRQIPVLIKYQDGGTRAMVFRFTTKTHAGAIKPDSRCLDDLEYCDGAISKKIHKHSGVWEGDRCRYVFDEIGSCNPQAEPSINPNLPPTPTPGGITTLPTQTVPPSSSPTNPPSGGSVDLRNIVCTAQNAGQVLEGACTGSCGGCPSGQGQAALFRCVPTQNGSTPYQEGTRCVSRCAQYCPTISSPTPRPALSSQTPQYPDMMEAKCDSGGLRFKWKQIDPNAKGYLLRVDKDPDSWSGSYNVNAGDYIFDRVHHGNYGDGWVTNFGFSPQGGSAYKWWIHARYDDGPYEAGGYDGMYKGRFGSRIEGGVVVCP